MRVVDQIPDVQIDIPLPEERLSDGAFLHVSRIPNGRYENEMVLAVMGTAAIREGRWHAISVDAFLGILDGHPWNINTEGVVHAARQMAEQGLLEIVTVADQGNYVVPMSGLADLLRRAQLREVPAHINRG